MTRQIVHVGTPPPDDRRALLEELLAFIRKATGLTDDDELYSFTRDDAGTLIAGLYGRVWGGTCEIALFSVRKDHRGRGIGARMLDAAEKKARELACHQMVLTTHDFQAVSTRPPPCWTKPVRTSFPNSISHPITAAGCIPPTPSNVSTKRSRDAPT